MAREWIDCDSSNVHSYCWVDDGQGYGLCVRFKDVKTGKVKSSYEIDCPKAKFNGLDRAPSKGEYFNKNIRGKYPERPVSFD